MPAIDWENDSQFGLYRIISRKDYNSLTSAQRELVDQYAEELRRKHFDGCFERLQKTKKRSFNSDILIGCVA